MLLGGRIGFVSRMVRRGQLCRLGRDFRRPHDPPQQQDADRNHDEAAYERAWQTDANLIMRSVARPIDDRGAVGHTGAPDCRAFPQTGTVHSSMPQHASASVPQTDFEGKSLVFKTQERLFGHAHRSH
jgi:hypothetical protein